MGLFHKAKRVAKLGVACLATYYVARACNDVAFGQEPRPQEYHTTIEETYTTRTRGDTLETALYRPRSGIREVGGEAVR